MCRLWYLECMKIRLLCENAASGLVWQAEWGFSALVNYYGTSILFDTGYSDVWLKNAEIAGLDLDEVDVIALSHFHDDHTRGLLHHRFEKKHRVICHPRVLFIFCPGFICNISPTVKPYISAA